MNAPTTFACVLLIAISPLLAACGGGGGGGFIKPGEEVAALAMWIWLAADQDAFVSSSQPSANYGIDPSLHAEDTAAMRDRVYTQFTMPLLPAGSVVEAAYLELLPTSSTPAPVGGEVISFVPVEDPWTPLTLTYDNQPRSFPGINQFDVKPSNSGFGWWSSSDLKRYADYKLANPNLNYGFVSTRVVNPNPTSSGLSFHSNNSGARTPQTIGNGPRFILKVILPPGATQDDVSMPPLASGHDLLVDASGKAARALLFTGDKPPASWGVAAAQ